MALVAPKVVGPLSECSDSVTVKGQLSGATVNVYADGTLVASGTSSGASETLSLTQSLSPGEMVEAEQTVGSQTSSRSAHPVEVQKVPPDVGPVGFPTKLFECAQCLRVNGLVPGATVEIRENGTVIGTASTTDGNTRVSLSQPLSGGSNLVAQQEACGQDGIETSPPPLQHPTGNREAQGQVLPAPEVDPILACTSNVTVSGVYPGAEVTVTRSGGPNFDFCFDVSAYNVFGLAPPFSAGETVTAEQSFPNCEVFSSGSEPVVVDPTDQLPRPGIETPLCAGARTVTVTNLAAGATVRITVSPSGGGAALSTVFRGEAPDSGSFTFGVDPLPANATVEVEQELCSHVSDASDDVEVEEAPEDLAAPVVVEPVYECSSVVHVRNLHPGTRVKVHSDLLGAPIGEKQVFDTETDVQVTPLTIAGDELTAVAVGCGSKSDRSAPVRVRELDELEPPTVVPPVDDCDETVTVEDVVPGAHVDVYVNGAWRGRATTGETETEVPVSVGDLDEGDVVRARQTLCGQVSDLSQSVEVNAYEGEWVQIGGKEKAEIIAIHACLLPGGKVMYFGGDQHSKQAHERGNIDNTRVFDVDDHSVTTVTGVTDDLFCAGHAMLEDGSMLAGGGTAEWGHGPGSFFKGSRASWRFEPSGNWNDTKGKLRPARPRHVAPGGSRSNTGGRWYPTLVTMPDGTVLTMGGEPLADDTRDTNASLERYDPSSQSWSLVGNQDYRDIPGVKMGTDKRHSEYMRLFVLPDGSVLNASAMGTDDSVQKWIPGSDPTTWQTLVKPDKYTDDPQSYTAALLPLRPEQDWQPRVLLAGKPTPWVLQVNGSSGSFQKVPRTLQGTPNRQYAVATLLPTGEVAVTGGARGQNDSTAVNAVELFDPAKLSDPTTNPWRVGPAATVVRNYHSVALLLPDGSVWTAGSNEHAQAGGEGVREKRIEIYKPWYFCEDRPVITDIADRVCHGETLDIRMDEAQAVGDVVLVRCGSVTHGWNGDQRHVSLRFQRSGDRIEASVPSNAAIAIPGYYLAFVLDDDGVPSEGEYVQICQSPSYRIEIDPDRLRRMLRDFGLRDQLLREMERDIRNRIEDAREGLALDGGPSALPGTLRVADLHVDSERDDHETLADEYVVFENAGEEPLDLSGWSVEDTSNHTYVFPPGVTLDPGDRLRLRSGSGTDTETDRYWGAAEPVWNNDSDTISVYDNRRRRVLQHTYTGGGDDG